MSHVARNLALIVILSSCGGAGPVKIDESALPTVVEFVAEAARRNVGVNLSGLDITVVHFTDTGLRAGDCRMPGKKIRLNADYWNRAPAFERRLLLFHELGHCLLKRAHVPGARDSIMNPTLFSEYGITAEYWVELVDELFGARHE